MTRFATLHPDEPLARAVQLLLSSSQQDFPVVRDDSVVGLLTRRDLMSALHDLGPAAPVSTAMRRDVAPVDAVAPLEEIFQQMQRENLPALPVVDSGRLAGLITLENIAEFLMISNALQGTTSEPAGGLGRSSGASDRPGEPGAGPWRRRGAQL